MPGWSSLDTGHLVSMEAPDETLDLLLAFLEE